MNKEIWSKAEENIKLLSNDEIEKKVRLQKKYHTILLVIFTISLFLLIGLSVICFVFGEIGLAIFSLIITVCCAAYPTILLIRMIKKDRNYFAILDEYRILMKNQLQTKINTTKAIKEVVLLDTRTVVTDKLHAVLNWQEIKQTRVYSFKVIYEDNTEQILNVEEGSSDYMFLISKVKQPSAKEQKSNAEEIREYKKLLDDGIITQEEFDKKKNELLNKD